jgi:hypothetical protein
MPNIQFGGQKPIKVQRKQKARAGARKTVVEDGLETNGFSTHDCETKFENIKVNVNVCRVKDDDPGMDTGVAKGAICAGIPVTVPTNNAGATVQAMKKRCDYAPQLEDITSFKRGHELVMAKFKPMETIRVDKDLIEKYLETCSGSKAQRLLQALEGDEWRSDMGTKHVFAKQEVLLKEHRAQPRVIYQGTDMYNALTGPVVMELNARMKEVFSLRNPLNTGNRIIYACGVSGEELGDIMESSGGDPVESDMKNNDGSQSKEFRRPEAMFYRKLGAPDWFVREFGNTTTVRVWTRYGVAATIEGERWSGETTTTTGNSYVSMCQMQAALECANIERSTNIHGGDDYLGYIEGDADQFKAGIEAVTKASGMKAEVVPQVGRHHATFYRKRYVRSAIGCRPVPQFGRVIAKMNLRPNRNTQVNDRDYMAGKYLCAAYEHRHVPGISGLLLNTSEALSDKPYLDVRSSKLKEMGGRDNVTRLVEEATVHSVPEFSEFLNEVYGINYDDLVDTYARVAQSCLDYCDRWVRVGKNGKPENVKGNSAYVPVKMGGDTVEALLRVDVSE